MTEPSGTVEAVAKSFSDEQLTRLVRQGRKVDCPICQKRLMSQCYQSFSSSGIGQHIRSVHPELEPEVRAASQRMERRLKDKEAADKREATLRPLREHTVTGAFLDEVASELEGLISMMEPYYAQSKASDGAYDLIQRIEDMQLLHPERTPT